MAPMSGSSGDLQRILEGPDDAALSAEQRAVLDLARTAFTELGKLVKNMHLYGADHQANERFRERFAQAMQTLVARQSPVEISVAPFELSIYERTLYENDTPDRNFVYRFFMDGVRRLTFQAGLTEAELQGLLDILLTDWSDPSLFEDDVVTLMWNKEFQHIGYVVAEDYGDDAREGEEHHYTIAGVLENVRKRGEVPVEVPGETTDTRSRRKAQRLSDDIGLTAADLERFEEHPFAMDEDEFRRLKAVLHNTSRETLEKFIEILFRVSVDDTAGGNREERIVGIFDRIAELQLEAGNVGELERLLRKVRRLGSGGGAGRASPRVVANPSERAGGSAAERRDNSLSSLPFSAADVSIDRIFARWSSPEFVQRVGAVLSDRASPHTPSALAIFTLLDEAALPAVVALAGKVRIPERRQALLALLPQLIRSVVQAQELARLLKEVDQALAHELLKALRSFNDSRVLGAAIRAGLQNPEPAVRLEVLSSLPAEEVPRHHEVLLPLLKDPARLVRGKALHLLVRQPDAFVHEEILVQLDDKSFAAFDLDERRRFYVAAALTGDPNTRFLALLASGGLLNRSRPHEENRHCAAVALAVRMCPEAQAAFEKELGRRLKSDVVAEACTWGLAHQKSDREARTRQLYDLFFRGELTSGVAHG